MNQYNTQSSSGSTLSGNGLPQAAPEVSADLDRLREDFRTFIADCQTLLRNAGNLSGEGAALARQELSRRMADAQVKLGEFRQTANDLCPPEIATLFIARAENIARSLQLGMFFQPGAGANRAGTKITERERSP